MPKNRIKRCLLCGDKLAASSVTWLWLHPASEVCSVKLADDLGVCVDDRYELADDGQIYEREATADQQLATMLGQTPQLDPNLGEVTFIEKPYVASDYVAQQIFDNAGVPRLGGASGDRGWSSISTFQRCPYLWHMRYNVAPRVRGDVAPLAGPEALEVGGTTHTFLALYYQRQIDPEYPITPEAMRDGLIAGYANPDYVVESWRLYEAYRVRYADDVFRPLAVEYRLVDPKTGRSCRYDLVAALDEPHPGLLPGVYLIDHKTASRFDYATLNQWRNDGELLGQWELYEKLKLEKRFGPLAGLCANIIGKQKEPKFERVFVNPTRALLRDHRRSVAVWSAMIDYAKTTGTFPRARGMCSAKGVLCENFEHCSLSGEETIA